MTQSKQRQQLSHREVALLAKELVKCSVKENWSHNPKTLKSLVERYKDTYPDLNLYKMKRVLCDLELPYMRAPKIRRRTGKTIDSTARTRIQQLAIVIKKICEDLGIEAAEAFAFLDDQRGRNKTQTEGE